MKSHFSLFAVFLFLVACGQDAERVQAEIDEQEKKIVNAKTIVQLEQKRLVELQDSLEINIRQNIALNMDTTTAAAIEKERLALQETLVETAKRNLDSQQGISGPPEKAHASPEMTPFNPRIDQSAAQGYGPARRKSPICRSQAAEEPYDPKTLTGGARSDGTASRATTGDPDER